MKDYVRRIAIKAKLQYINWKLKIGLKVSVSIGGGYKIWITNPNEFIQRQILKHVTYEKHVIEVFENIIFPGVLLFDVGSNIGHHSLHAVRCGATVHAFEPVPLNADLLESNLRLNNLSSEVKVIRKAVGERNGMAMIHAQQTHAYGSSSLIMGIRDCQPSLEYNAISVPITTLDSYVTENNLRYPDIIKIDVEGYEARVLDGAYDILSSGIPPILIFETADRLADHIDESSQSVIARLINLDYKVYAIGRSGLNKKRIVNQNDASSKRSEYLAFHKSSSIVHRIERLQLRLEEA